MKSIFISVLLFLGVTYGQSQDFAIGIGGKLLPSFSESQDIKRTFNNLFSYGGIIRIVSTHPFPLYTGFQVSYSNRNIITYTHQPDLSIPIDFSRDISITEYTIPIGYSYQLSEKINLCLGVNVSYNYFKIVERTVFYNWLGNPLEISISDKRWTLSPNINIVSNHILPVVIIANIEYSFYKPKLVKQSSYTTLINNYEYDLNGLRYGLTILYEL